MPFRPAELHLTGFIYGWCQNEQRTALPISRRRESYTPACRSSRFWHCGSFSGSTRNTGDFTRWKDHDAYSKALDRLLRDLRVEKA